MKIYVASSWRNEYQPTVVSGLCKLGYDVYDFREYGYVAALQHEEAIRGFNKDMQALQNCDVCLNGYALWRILLVCG